MAIVKVAINGYGTIGKRVADAVDAQDDMEVVGVTKTGPSFGCEMAVRKNFDIYSTSDDPEMIRTFDNSPFECKGGLKELLAISDVVIDCSPGKMGEDNLRKIPGCWSQECLSRRRKTLAHRPFIYIMR